MLDPRLRQIFASVFGIDPDSLGEEDSPTSIPEWDSVNHIHLILSLESEFGVSFDPGEIGELSTVAAIASRLERFAGADG